MERTLEPTIHPALASVDMDQDQLAQVRLLREQFSDLMLRIEGMSASRERSIAMTKIEEASMWAVKAVSRA